MSLKELLQELGEPVESPEEETFELFTQEFPSSLELGIIDPKAAVLDLTVAGRDLSIHQSPGVLSSNRAGGTTGAVIWKITPLFAEWISNSSSLTNPNPLFTSGILSSDSFVCELGCGISPIVALTLAPKISRYVLTDQPYVAKFVEQNIQENQSSITHRSSNSKGSHKKTKAGGGGGKRAGGPAASGGSGVSTAAGNGDGDGGKIHFAPLDWETDEVTPALTGRTSSQKSFDVVLACDCIYNEALIDPFVTACADLCRLREEDESEASSSAPCVCVIAQQLRDEEIFESWMTRFCKDFKAWRVPDHLLVEGLRSGSGFAVHIGVLKERVPVKVQNNPVEELAASAYAPLYV
ncbi:ribosomal lysine N-methyltransferase 5 [Podospora australis]|uniref:Ribosomal lysine N-methyltransferase 5 n=1 Tax=Podospora australis TaxID=1536484 RepID=A0AAN6X103_9PEZI|nr:ribosomal lysine N-methyltransferase 5 [Podospora australis]